MEGKRREEEQRHIGCVDAREGGERWVKGRARQAL